MYVRWLDKVVRICKYLKYLQHIEVPVHSSMYLSATVLVGSTLPLIGDS